jgi:hypothetical protein
MESNLSNYQETRIALGSTHTNIQNDPKVTYVVSTMYTKLRQKFHYYLQNLQKKI